MTLWHRTACSILTHGLSIFGETVTALEIVPEGSSYRAKTGFAKFHNMPELMQMFREVADIQTDDMLKLPGPNVNY